MKAKKILFGLLSILCFGFSTFALASCGEQPTSEPTPEPHVHDWQEIGRVSATCTEAGGIAYVCPECEETKAVILEEAKGHDFVYIREFPTCTEQGYTAQQCKECGFTDNYMYDDPLGHTKVIDAAIEPTCTETGLTEGEHCSKCNKEFVTQEVIEPLGHSYKNNVCTKCGDDYFTEGLSFDLLYHGESYAIVGYTGAETEVIIPTIYHGLPVTEIYDNAFKGCESLTNIKIPNSITSIGSYTFENCSSLTNITLPNSVTEIGFKAFRNCSSLTNIIIPEGITYIDKGTFMGCTSLISITIPFVGGFRETNNVADASHFGYIFGADYYYENSYYVPSSLKEVIITNATSIGYGAFYGCSSLTSITIPDSVTSIGMYAFYDCSLLVEIILPNAIKEISAFAFAVCSSLKYIKIPDGVTSIGDDAFEGCSSLTSVVIPDSVTSISVFAFYGCDALTSVASPAFATVCLPMHLQTVIITSGDAIPDGAFYQFSSLTSIVIPDSVTSIGDSAFFCCSSLTTVYYTGTEEQWKKISIYYCNDDLENATIIYNYKG